jgi:hypothetical protein
MAIGCEGTISRGLVGLAPWFATACRVWCEPRRSKDGPVTGQDSDGESEMEVFSRTGRKTLHVTRGARFNCRRDFPPRLLVVDGAHGSLEGLASSRNGAHG